MAAPPTSIAPAVSAGSAVASVPAPPSSTLTQTHTHTHTHSQTQAIAGGQLQVRVTHVAEGQQPYRQLKVEDALAYLDKVKTQFGSKPAIYNKFLEIMKAFKAQTIDTPGVIRRVSDLFRGHPMLILGFNTFLPPGYKIEVVQNAPGGVSAGLPLDAAAPHAHTHSLAPAPAPSPASSAPLRATAAGMAAAAPPAAPSMPVQARAPVRLQAPPPRTGPGAQGAQGPLEFDHAISYVTKIKRRFANDPATYKSFLEILHTYQKQQRSIKDVLERVSVLFKDHADLLRDFTYFLPDAVQATAKDRIERSAENARAREAAEKTAAGMVRGGAAGAYGRAGPRGYDGRGGFEPGAAPAGYVRPGMAAYMDQPRQRARDEAREYDSRMADMQAAVERKSQMDRDRERLIDRARDRLTVGMGPGKSSRMQLLARRRRGREEEMHLTLTPTERNFFDRMKSALGTREAWVECLKCLDLFAAEVLSRAELLALLSDLFGPGNEKLVQELKTMLNNRGTLEMTPEDIWYSMPIGEIDLSQCAHCTPSYRALPAGYPVLACSERSKMERELLNDVWVSVPTGSEDYSFKIMRKNQYEDALFRCEDERYEIDMVIENNASAIRVLEPLSEEIEVLKRFSKGIEWQFRLDRRSLGVLHLKAIARVYGEYGNEVLELLRKNPAGAIPIVLARLKQKDDEWRRARTELNKTWKEVMEKNYYKSLDHRSFYFKQQDKKTLSSRALLGEMKAKVDAFEAAVREYVMQRADEVAEAERAKALAATAAAQAAATGEVEMADVGAAPAPAPEGKPEGEAAAAAVSGAPLTEALDISTLPAAIRTKLRSLAPALHFLYRDINMHRDAYNVLSYAIEKTAHASDKAPVADLWRSFMVKFFQFPQEWLRVGGDALQGQLLQLGDLVQTPYGIGVIENVRVGPPPVAGERSRAGEAASGSSQVAYHVMFQWGRGILGAESVTPASKAAPSGLAADFATAAGGSAAAGRVKPLNVDPAVYTNGAAPAPSSDVLTLVEKIQDTEYVRGPVPPPESIAYLTGTGYVFFRLHEMLVDRLGTAKILCARVKAHQHAKTESAQAAAASRKADQAAAAAAAGSVGVTLASSSSGKSTAVLAAAAGDLSSAAAAGLAPGSSGDPESAADAMIIEDEAAAAAAAGAAAPAPAPHHADEGDEAYQHYLTALYALIDGSMDASKYEDECRELMGTGAYLMFTMDRLVGLCAKQLVLLTHEPVSVRLRTLWEYTQAQIRLARGLYSGAEADKAITAALQSYRANVGSALVSRGTEDCYCVQYVVNPPESAPADIFAALGVDAAGGSDPAIAAARGTPTPAHRIASLSIRYIGKPLYDNTRGTIRGYEYSSALPAYLSRLSGAKRVIVGDEAAEVIDEEALADEIATEARNKLKSTFLPRTLRAAGEAGAAAGVEEAAAEDAAVGGYGLGAGVEEAGKVRFSGGEEAYGRRAGY